MWPKTSCFVFFGEVHLEWHLIEGGIPYLAYDRPHQAQEFVLFLSQAPLPDKFQVTSWVLKQRYQHLKLLLKLVFFYQLHHKAQLTSSRYIYLKGLLVLELEVLTLEEKMKLELLFEAYKKFSLSELEEKLGGNKFTL